MITDFPTAPLASGLREAGGGTVEKSFYASHTEILTLPVSTRTCFAKSLQNWNNSASDGTITRFCRLALVKHYNVPRWYVRRSGEGSSISHIRLFKGARHYQMWA